MADLDHQYITTLVEYARKGDSDAFAELYLATCQRQYRFAYEYLKDEHLTQSVIRDTYIFVLQNIAALKDTVLFLPWLSQITLRLCLNAQKEQQKRSEEPDKLPLEDLDPEEHIVRVEGHDFLIRQIMNLPFTESQVVILKYYNKLKIREIARLMNMRTGAVKLHLANGCRKLKQLAGQERERRE